MVTMEHDFLHLLLVVTIISHSGDITLTLTNLPQSLDFPNPGRKSREIIPSIVMELYFQFDKNDD